MITVTSLQNPVMIKKIRFAMRCAALKQGVRCGGHDHRAYVSNSKGHNIMRIDWRNGSFIIYGGADWGMTEVTDVVRQAFKRYHGVKK